MLDRGGWRRGADTRLFAEEARLTRDQTGPSAMAAGRAWEYYAAVADTKPLGG